MLPVRRVLTLAARRSLLAVPVTIPRLTAARTFASQSAGRGAGEGGGGGGNTLIAAALGAAAGAAGYRYYFQNDQSSLPKIASDEPKDEAKKQPLDYQKVYNAIAAIIEDENYDDGSYGPVFLRLAWHASGTYDKTAKDGGSNFATMRFKPEAGTDANAGLGIARERLNRIKDKFPDISYGDLWTLAGVAAIQEMGGPIVKWRPGRVDGDEDKCPPDGRLPDGARPDSQHTRDIFYKMGFNDQEIVALLGAHALGRCHPERSGFDGPWTASPTVFTNSFFTELLGRKWTERKWKGPKQFEDQESKSLMMLPADMVIASDKEFRKWAEIYAKDEAKFFEDFAKAVQKLFELGVKFDEKTKVYEFKPTNA